MGKMFWFHASQILGLNINTYHCIRGPFVFLASEIYSKVNKLKKDIACNVKSCKEIEVINMYVITSINLV